VVSGFQNVLRVHAAAQQLFSHGGHVRPHLVVVVEDAEARTVFHVELRVSRKLV